MDVCLCLSTSVAFRPSLTSNWLTSVHIVHWANWRISMGQIWEPKNIPLVLQLAKIGGLGNLGQEPLFESYKLHQNAPNWSDFATKHSTSAAPRGRAAHFGQLDVTKSAQKGLPCAGWGQQMVPTLHLGIDWTHPKDIKKHQKNCLG